MTTNDFSLCAAIIPFDADHAITGLSRGGDEFDGLSNTRRSARRSFQLEEALVSPKTRPYLFLVHLVATSLDKAASETLWVACPG